MKANTNHRILRLMATLALALPWLAAPASMQAQASSSRLMGSITSIQGNVLTVKTDAGEQKVQIPAATPIKRVAPGQTNLSTADSIPITELANGDRVLVKIDPANFSSPLIALQVVVVKQDDLAQKQQKERDDWQHRGIGGLVQSVDAATGVIVISNSATGKETKIHVSNSTLLRRYAANSVNYADSKPAPLSAIREDDQLRARGNKNADGSEFQAEEIVSGSFRNLSGLIASINPATSTLQIKDLATKKPVNIHISPDSQIRRLPDALASMLAARAKGAATGAAPYTASANGAAHTNGNGGAPQRNGNGNSNDPQQMLSRLPTIPLSELKTGEAIMVVATGDDGEVNAITLLAGVQALLEAPAGQNLLANWSMGSGESE